jgi:hypothetical protein
VVETSVPAALRERASLQPDDTAFTLIDHVNFESEKLPADHAKRSERQDRTPLAS